MPKIKPPFVLLLVVLLFIAVFYKWFFPLSLSTGDWLYRHPQAIQEYFAYPYAWDTSFQNGLGGNTIFLLALNTYFYATTSLLFTVFHIPWIFIERIMWYFPFIVVSAFGAFLLFRKLITNSSLFAGVASVIFSTNTYALMISGGGQLGVGMGYAMMPIVLWSFVNIFSGANLKNKTMWSLISGLLFSLQLTFDLRMAYVAAILIGIYYLFQLLFASSFAYLKNTFLYFCVIPVIVVILIHLFWLVPFVLVGQNPLENLGEAFSNEGIVKFLSFASFENTISLLHSHWPENIFGKAYFMRPEFLVIPILAFLSLAFLNEGKKERAVIITLAFMGLFGAFLSKGAAEPFGNVYIWLFNTFPGFMMFRDATKWYALTAVSYSILIPYVLYVLGKQVKKTNLVLIIFLAFWLFTIRQSVMGELKGTFSPRVESAEYLELSSFLGNQQEFFRTLWYPSLHQFHYSTPTHPAVPGADFLQAYSNSAFLKKIKNEETISLLDNASIKYVIVPSDTEGKIFTDDRVFSQRKYNELVTGLEKDPQLKFVKKIGNIMIFENEGFNDHFWIDGEVKVPYEFISPVLYRVHIKNSSGSGKLIFSESFDPNWTASINNNFIQSKKYGRINSFELPDGSYNMKIYYKPQDLINRLFPVSIVSFIVIIGILILMVIKKGGRQK